MDEWMEGERESERDTEREKERDASIQTCSKKKYLRYL